MSQNTLAGKKRMESLLIEGYQVTGIEDQELNRDWESTLLDGLEEL